ncbi:MAG: hypothetical protein PVG19_01385 [Desulfobacterales bacterium]|jgi:hypothetical protein
MVEEVRLNGLLIPNDWHANGRVKSLTLATDDEKEITLSGLPSRLMKLHLRQRVDVWGTFADSQNPAVFKVRRLRRSRKMTA